MNERYIIVCRTGGRLSQYRENGVPVLFVTREDAERVITALSAANFNALQCTGAYAEQKAYWIEGSGC